MTPAELLGPLLSGDEQFAVTGASGWFGGAALDLLADAGVTQVTGYASRTRSILTPAGRKHEVRTLADLPTARPHPTHLLHFGFLTRDRVAGLGVPAYLQANLQITGAVLDVVARACPRAVLLTSSGAVYGPDRALSCDVAGNPYGTLKHLDELVFRQACADVDAACVISRVFSVAGAGMTKPSLYALGDLVQAARRGGPLQVRARGPVLRSYVAVRDVVALMLWSALRGESIVFDSGGPAVEMDELARVVAQVHGLGDDAVVREWDPHATADRYVGDGTQMAGLAQRAGLVLTELPELVRETSADLAARG